jgi:dUTP pyrophosphatase
VELRFQRLTEAARLPTRAHEGDAGLDLYAAEAVVVPPAGGRIDVGTGVATEIPEGHAGLVLPRSGNARKHGITLTNAPGLIDAGYRGELRVLILNTDPADAFEIAPGDRIAQLVIVAVALAEPVEADELGNSQRGERGFGSSGLA